jgi:hypothetical protein
MKIHPSSSPLEPSEDIDYQNSCAKPTDIMPIDYHKKRVNTIFSRTITNEVPAKEGTDSMGKITTLQTNNTAKKPKISKKERLLSNPDIKRWHDNLARGSVLTAEVRLRRLGRFCEEHDITPMQLVELGIKDARSLADLLQDHITEMEEKGKAPGYIRNTLVAVNSWLRHFDIEVKRKMKIANVNSTPSLENEKVPEASELAELFNRARLRSGAIMALMAKSGLRPEVLGNHTGTDGLMIKDLPDLVIVQGFATFARTPPRLVVRKTISKARHEYFTFITDLGAKKLLAYLNERILAGEPMNPDTPVIAPKTKYAIHRKERNGRKFLTTRIIENDVRKAIRPRFKWRPYVLRAYFDTQLLIAESRGKIAHDFRIFFMGHKGSIEARYTTNKSILPKALLGEMRESFKRSEEFLDLEKAEYDPVEKTKEEVKDNIEKLSPDQLARVQMLVRNLAGCNTSASS